MKCRLRAAAPVWMGLSALLVAAGCAGTEAREAEALGKKEVRKPAVRRPKTPPGKLAAARVVVLDGFDGRLLWRVDTAESNPATIAPVKEGGAASKDQAMAVAFKAGKKNKVVVGRRFFPFKDLSTTHAVVVDVESQLKEDCRLSLALLTMPGWKYHESRAVVIRPGTNKDVVFRVGGATFKTAASKWRHTQRVAHLSAVGKMAFILHVKGGGTVLLNNLRVAQFPAPKAKKPKPPMHKSHRKKHAKAKR